MNGRIFLLTFGLLMGTHEVASAQVATGELARQLVTEGVEAAKELNWVEARDRFQRAYAIQPLPLTLFNLATAQEKTGQLVEADRSYRIFLRETSEGQHDAFRKAAAERRGILKKRIAFVRLEAENLNPADVLQIGESEVAHAVLGRPIPSNPGEVTVRVRRGGEVIAEQSLVVEEGVSRRVALKLPLYVPPVPELPQAAAPSPTPVGERIALQTPREEDEGGVLDSGWFWLTVGLAVAAGAGAGLYLGLRPNDPYASDLDPISLSGR